MWGLIFFFSCMFHYDPMWDYWSQSFLQNHTLWLPVPKNTYLSSDSLLTSFLKLRYHKRWNSLQGILLLQFLHKPKQIFWDLSLKTDYLKNQNPLSLELNYLSPQDIYLCLKRVMWCVTQPILLSMAPDSHHSGPECPLGRFPKLSCFLLAFKYLPVLLLLLHLGLFGCQVTKGVPGTCGREDPEGPSSQAGDIPWCIVVVLQAQAGEVPGRL